MGKDYTEFDHSDDNEDDDDDDIGALGSILSWDENEDGVVGGTPVGVNGSIPNSVLPDLVSFSHLKDKDSGLSYLQQPLVGSNGNHDDTANLPLPTRINYQAAANQNHGTVPAPAPLPQTTQDGQAKQKEATSNTSAQQQAQLQQQQQQIRLQQQQIQQQQQQIQQQQLQQQFGLQQHQRMQQHLVTGAPAQAQGPQQALGPQPPSQPQQQQVVTQQAQVQQVPQQPTPHATNLQGGVLSLLQQNALLAQQNAMVMPGVPQPTGQEKPADQQQQPQAAPQFIDPNSILRRLQVAQLQQQFNAVQQAQAVHAQAQAQAALQQQQQQRIQYPGQVQMIPSAVTSVPIIATTAAVQPALSATKKTVRGMGQKAPQTQTKEKSRKSLSTKSPLVSASDTDGEFSLKHSNILEKKPSGTRKKNEAIDMSNMTPEERQKANRDRNREHARNTRLRKKAYLETLKSTVNDLCQERDTLVTERAGAASILVEMNNTRTEVLMSFFALRSANEKRRPLWASILDESSFTCVLPVTPYRSFPASEVQVSKCQRTILGIDGMMSDTASLHVLLNTLVDRSRFPTAAIQFRYTLVTEEAVVAGNQMMARWVMQTLNATKCGARMEVSKQGMLCCKFNSAHKIVGLELMFDVMALMLQLKQAAGSETFSVIPNTVQTCQRSFDSPMVMILADEPYTIVQVNKLWEDMSGYKAEEVVGRTSSRVLEGSQTDANAVEVFMDEIRFKRPTSAMILHYKKSGQQFKNFFTAYPLSTDSRITHYLMFTSHVGAVTGGDVSSKPAPTTVAETQHVLPTNPQQVAIQPNPAQNNYLTQNLRANFNAAQRQAAATTSAPLNFQPLIALPPVLPNHPVAPPNSILSTNIPPTSQPSAGYLPQQLQINAQKRPHESISTGEVGS
uniref:BZIP domain-containing protein n=1 Tax=Pseudo-nitzschia arenysensis TaxID=697910 RepID=A0A6T9YEN6_9STRA|mmetsp:Transcript_132/g.316  ORF Transcript_132/g.316 Transcript_132/m.316 type:complete len:901 (+) Transcript_132:227-2929(+)|eukprot:CAMPEP_0116140282 /NCGR_PEP_ID=MMETSP0329-20121206/13758_1 /TAXON_ID=697910 /ORGANISM="Pseudo-nitzschia arenysensis, Strain B593" /LENGTH=900 /DNA_ID=CAMNT_0003635373 /DNA_START=119 /DNA_END=2821 /DNA_ORIENTATION=+